MQLELGVGSRARNASPRVLALYFPDLPLQRLLRAREAAGRRGSPRTPLAVERNGEVVACNAEARARGIQRGDTLGRARLACAELEAVPADEAGDRAALMGIAEALLVLSPTVEISWPDVLLLDASGAHLFAREGTSGEPAMAERAVALASDLGLRCRVAIASGRGPARVLARHGLVSGPVAPEDAPAMLASLPIMALELPPGVADRFACLGLREIGEVARLPAATLAHRFGAPGLAAWRLAHGDDPSPLVPHVPREPPAERLELEAPLEGSQPLLFGLRRLCDRLAVRLAGRGLGATRLALVLGLDPRGEQRLEIALASPSSAAARWLLVLRERLDSLRLPAAVTSAVLSVMEAAPTVAEQLALGDRPEQLAALEVVLARLSARLGDGALFAAKPADRHRPEVAYQATAFVAKCKGKEEEGPRRRGGDASSPAEASVAESASPPLAALVRPTRLLPRPQPLVALGEGGRLVALRVGGQTLRVLALSPAERLAGEWWSDPFDRDYHRARIEGLGECWIFRDAGDGRLWLHGFFD